MPDSLGRKYSYVQLEYSNLLLKPGEEREILDVHEEGEIIIIEYHCANKKLAMEINVWGDSGSPINVQDFHDDFETLLQLGWGLTPKEIAPVNNVSPDPHGTPNSTHPFLTRYKDTTEADYTGETDRWYSMNYCPNPRMEYGTRIQITVKNGDSQNNALIRDIVVNRKVYQHDVEKRPH